MRSSLLLLVLALLCLAFVGCGNDEEYPPEDTVTLEEGKADSTCTVRCTPCPPTAQRCNIMCVNVGNCHAGCPTFEYCSPGYKWSEPACRCIPDVP
jgi:hypothetical protein